MLASQVFFTVVFAYLVIVIVFCMVSDLIFRHRR